MTPGWVFGIIVIVIFVGVLPVDMYFSKRYDDIDQRSHDKEL